MLIVFNFNTITEKNESKQNIEFFIQLTDVVVIKEVRKICVVLYKKSGMQRVAYDT